MYFQQSDLFWGMDKDFVKAVVNIAAKKNYAAGDVLFRTGDAARHFYILLTGRVKLRIGETGQVAYSVDHAGEAFGWSSLVGLDSYSASAECMETTTLQRFERGQFHEILKKDPSNGLIFFHRLSGIIGKRLLWSYKMLTASEKAAVSPSFGSEQVQESEAMV